VASGSSKADLRRVRGRAREDDAFPAAPPLSGLPRDYAAILGEIKQRIREERLRVVMAANSAMILLYWDIGRLILERQERAGWGARVIDRLAADLTEAYPEMKGLSPRNLKYMRAFAAAWPERSIVQEPLARIPWYHHIALMEKCRTPAERLWYARQSAEQGWSHNILSIQIGSRVHERQGKAVTNFAATLPPARSDLAAQVFKDPYLFDFLGTADPRREREVEQALVDHIQRFLLLLCRAKNRIVVEYALRDLKKPIGVAEWETRIVKSLPKGSRAACQAWRRSSGSCAMRSERKVRARCTAPSA
jgi:predicted nuclease of restriction endonuclease-like (RecB) superfamily